MSMVLGHNVVFVDTNRSGQITTVECDGVTGRPTVVLPPEVRRWFQDQPHYGGISCPHMDFDGESYSIGYWAFNEEEKAWYDAHHHAGTSSKATPTTRVSSALPKTPSLEDLEIKDLILAAFEKSEDKDRVEIILEKLIPSVDADQLELMKLQEQMAKIQARILAKQQQ